MIFARENEWFMIREIVSWRPNRIWIVFEDCKFDSALEGWIIFKIL